MNERTRWNKIKYKYLYKYKHVLTKYHRPPKWTPHSHINFSCSAFSCPLASCIPSPLNPRTSPSTYWYTETSNVVGRNGTGETPAFCLCRRDKELTLVEGYVMLTLTFDLVFVWPCLILTFRPLRYGLVMMTTGSKVEQNASNGDKWEQKCHYSCNMLTKTISPQPVLSDTQRYQACASYM